MEGVNLGRHGQLCWIQVFTAILTLVSIVLFNLCMYEVFITLNCLPNCVDMLLSCVFPDCNCRTSFSVWCSVSRRWLSVRCRDETDHAVKKSSEGLCGLLNISDCSEPFVCHCVIVTKELNLQPKAALPNLGSIYRGCCTWVMGLWFRFRKNCLNILHSNKLSQIVLHCTFLELVFFKCKIAVWTVFNDYVNNLCWITRNESLAWHGSDVRLLAVY